MMAETFRPGGRAADPVGQPLTDAHLRSDFDTDDDLRPKRPELSLGELFGKLTADVGELFRKEVQLAKLETKEEATRAGKAAGMLGGAAAVGYLAAILLSFALVWALSEVMHIAIAFLLVGAVYAVAAIVLFSKGKERMTHVQPVPDQTVATLKEDVEWAKAQRN